jgi:hypothetical protein
MKNRKAIKNFFSIPLKSQSMFSTFESLLGKSSGGYIISWHDLPSAIFKSQVESLYPSEPIPLDELIKRYKDGKSIKKCFAITFDDGVESTVQNVSEVCKKMNWPVTFYLPTGYLNGDSLPYQKIQFINENLLEDNYIIPEYLQKYEQKIFNKNQLIKLLTKMLYVEHFSVMNNFLDYFIKKIIDKEKVSLLKNCCPKPIGWSEIEKLSKNSILSFQSHSVSHTAVSSLNEKEIEDEMINSKRLIEQHTNKKVHSFCYPYGSSKSIGKLAPKIASKYFDSGTTLIRGRIKNSDPFYLPRIDLYENDTPHAVRLKVVLN